MLLDDIKKANVRAIKERNKTARNIYGVVINKLMLETIKRRDTDTALTQADEAQIINKTIKELKDEEQGYIKASRKEQAEEIARQIDIISFYLPKQLTDEEIKAIIIDLSDKSVPAVMKHFKENYNGKCDMRAVSTILKSL